MTRTSTSRLWTNIAWILFAGLISWLPFYNNGVFFPHGQTTADLILLSLLAFYAIVRAITVFTARQAYSAPEASATSSATPAAASEASAANEPQQSVPSTGGEVSSVPSRLLAEFTWFDAAFAVYVILYALSLFYAASLPLAVEGALNTVALLFPFGLVRLYGTSSDGLLWVVLGLAASSLYMTAIGVANGWGQLTFPSAIVTSPHLQVSSVFQYHNAYAAYAAAITIGMLVFVSLYPRWPVLRALLTGVAGLNMAGLFLSGSRGALLFWIIVLILVVIGLRGNVPAIGASMAPGVTPGATEPSSEDSSQPASWNSPHASRSRFLLYFGAAAIGAAFSYLLLHLAIVNHSATTGWAGFALGFLIPTVAVLALSLSFGSVAPVFFGARRTFPTLLIVYAILFLLAALAKSHSLLAKLHSYHIHQMSVIQRFIFWLDGLRIVARNPVTGNGFGAWAAMFKKIESYPYYSTQVHSFLVDTLIDVGILGTIALLLMVWPMVRSVVWPWKSILTPNPRYATLRSVAAFGLMLFAHSLMDWDFAFLALLILFFVGMGSGFALRKEALWQSAQAKAAASISEDTDTPAVGNAREPLDATTVDRPRKIERVDPAVVHAPFLRPSVLTRVVLTATVVTSLAALYFDANAVRGERIVAAANATSSFSTRLALFKEAHQVVPYNPNYLVDEANTVLDSPSGNAKEHFDQGVHLLQQAIALDPYNATLEAQMATIAFDASRYHLAYVTALEAYHNAPYFPTNLSLAINAAVIDGMQTAKTNSATAVSKFKRVLRLYADYQQRLKVVHNLPSYLPPIGPYTLQAFCYDSVATAELALGHNAKAEQFAGTVLNNPNAHTAQVAKMLTLIAKDGGLSALSAANVRQY
ncbi:MAG: O-antigen ligase family protein, partial [Firmicutes bacterium]|nr:O-antigen ligase family protein [Bacillota bacterium]